MYRNEVPKSTEEHVFDLTDRMERIEKRPYPTAPTALPVFIQPDEPVGAPTGSLWFDTNSFCSE